MCLPGPTGTRMATRDVEIGGYRVESGTMLAFGRLAVQRDPTLWEEPLIFDPTGSVRRMRLVATAEQYIPFGGGPRSCLKVTSQRWRRRSAWPRSFGAPKFVRWTRVPVGGAVHHGGRRSNLGTHSSAQLTTEEMTIASCTAQVLHADKADIRYLTPGLHAEMVSELRWPDDPCPETGIDVRSLQHGEIAGVEFETSWRRPDVMAHLAQWNAGTALGEDTRRRVVASCCRGGHLDTVAGARLTMRAADLLPRRYGLPHTSGGWLYNRSRQSSCMPAMSRISPNGRTAFADELGDLQKEFQQLVQIPATASPALVLLLPDSFIGIAESMDLAGELGRWVLRNACAEFSRWRSRGGDRSWYCTQCVASATGDPASVRSHRNLDRVRFV